MVNRRLVVDGHEVGVLQPHIEKPREVQTVGTRSLDVARWADVKLVFGTDLFRAPKKGQASKLLIHPDVLTTAWVLRSAAIGSQQLFDEARAQFL